MFDNLSFNIKAPEGLDLNMEQLMDINQMPLEELQDYREGVQELLAAAEGNESRLKMLQELIADIDKRISELK